MVSKKDWYETQADPTQHKFANEIQRLTEKYAAKDKDFTKTEQYRGYKGYLDPHPITGAGGIPSTKGGGLGAIREHDPVLSAGSQASQLARENLLYSQGNKRRGNLTAEDIKGINIPLVREGLSDADYFRFNQMLYSPNIKEYEKARRWGSGKGLRDIVTMATPAKYFKKAAETLGGKVLEVPEMIMGSKMVEDLKEDWEGRKKGRGLEGAKTDIGSLVTNILHKVGIGNTKKTNDFIKKTNNNTKTQDSSNDAAILEDLINTPLGIEEIKTNIQDIKKANGSGDYLTNKFAFKKGGIVSLYQGGPLDRKMNALSMGLGGLYGQGGIFGQGGGPRIPQLPSYQPWHPQQPAPWEDFGETLGGYGEQIGGFGETLGGYGEQIGGFGEQLGGYEDVLGGYGKDLSSFKDTMGGFGNQFENINKKLSSMEEGIASLSDKMGTTQGNTQPQRRSNFGFNSYNPWMFGGFGRFGYG